MFKFFKILLLIIIVSALLALGCFLYFHKEIYDSSKIFIAERLETALNKKVKIEKIGFSPFQTITLINVSILDYAKPDPKIYHFDKINLTMRMMDLIRSKKLPIIVDAGSLNVSNNPNPPERIVKEHPEPTLIKKIPTSLKPKSADLTLLIRSISISNFAKKAGPLRLNNLIGRLDLDIENTFISKGQFTFHYNNDPVSLSVKQDSSYYNVVLKSPDIKIDSTLSVENSSLSIKKALGSYQSIGFDLSGKIYDFMSDARFGQIQGSLSATSLDIDLDDTTTNKAKKRITINGEMTSKIKLSLKYPDIRSCTLNSEFSSRDLRINDLYINNIHANICYENNSLVIPGITISMYEGIIKGDLVIDIEHFKKPSITSLSAEITRINLEHLIGSTTKNENNISGILSGNLSLEKTTQTEKYATKKNTFLNEIRKYTGNGKFNIASLGLYGLTLSRLKSDLLIDKRIVSFSDINGDFYEGAFDANLVLDLSNDPTPYSFSASITQVNFLSLMKDLTKNMTKNMYGTLDADIDLTGYLDDSSSMKGRGQMSLVDANLGPMPILAPIIGDIYSAFQTIFTPKEIILIDSAEAYFEIMDRTVFARKMALWGKDVYITSKGTLDFDGNLDLYFENQFTDPGSEENEKWQNIIKTSIVKFGRSISSAHLKGTIKKPEWEFKYKINDIIGDNISKFLKGISG